MLQDRGEVRVTAPLSLNIELLAAGAEISSLTVPRVYMLNFTIKGISERPHFIVARKGFKKSR